MSWFEVTAARHKHTTFVSDQNKGELADKRASYLSFCVIFSPCEISYNGSYDELSKAFVEAIRTHSIDVEISCPADGVKNERIIKVRSSGTSFRIAMSCNEFTVALNMLSNSVKNTIIRLSTDDPYPYRANPEKLQRGCDLLEGRVDSSSYPNDEVAIDLAGFNVLFDN